jgi:hypothetical protein
MGAMRVLAALMLAAVFANSAIAQDTPGVSTSDREYATVALALEALRAKSGVKISDLAGWTVIEDRSTLSLWSFTPSGHPAHPAAIHRKVVQEGNNIFVKMHVLCEAPKPACDKVVADFQSLNQQVRKDMKQ